MWYAIEDVLEDIEELLEGDLLGEVVLHLVIESSLLSISLTEGNVDIEVLEGNAEGIVKNLFATTLLGTTIQDSSTRARSGYYPSYY